MNEHFRCLTTDTSTLAIGCWRADGTFFDVNEALLKLLGCTRPEIDDGRVRWRDITPPEFAPLDAQALAEIRANGECAPFEKEYVRCDGRRVPVLIGATAFGNGVMDAGAFYAVDLRQRKKLDDAELFTPEVLLLTERQRMICLLLSFGDSDKEIATVLDQSLRTVEADKQWAARQIGVPTPQVALWAVEHRRGLIAALERSGHLPPRVAEIASRH